MNQYLKVTLLFAICLAFAPAANAQDFPGLDKSPLDAAYYPPRAAFRAFAKNEEEKKASEPLIRVLYSRPQKKDRDVFGGLIKYGETWRAGANESTEILFYKDVMIGGKTVEAGRYTLYITPEKESWTVHINTALDGWGAYAYDPAKDVVSVEVPAQEAGETIEAFSIVFEKADDGAHMAMGWDGVVARLPIVLE